MAPPREPPMTIPEIQQLLANPVKPEDRKRMNAPRKDKIKAQLWYYGVDFGEYASLPSLEKTLREAVKGAKLTANPPRIVQYEKDKMTATRRKEQAWERCTTPGERAQVDIDRFMELYFLTDGRPDKNKTTQPLALYGFDHADGSKLHNWVARIPGLHVQQAGAYWGPSLTYCLGWDRRALSQLAQTIDLEARQKKQKKQKEDEDQAMATHRALVRAKEGDYSKGSNPLDKCKGSYIIRSEELECERGMLTLDIATGPNPHISQAAVSFEIIEGTMLLALSEADLDQYVAESHSESVFSEDYDDDEEEEEEAAPTSRKRKAPAAELKRGRGRPKKQAKKALSTAHRIHLRLKGRETGEGQMFFDAHKGHLDFSNDTYTSFTGIASIPYVGDAVKFQGFKVSDRARKRVEAWSNFSEAAYESARISRWH